MLGRRYVILESNVHVDLSLKRLGTITITAIGMAINVWLIPAVTGFVQRGFRLTARKNAFDATVIIACVGRGGGCLPRDAATSSPCVFVLVLVFVGVGWHATCMNAATSLPYCTWFSYVASCDPSLALLL